MAELKRYHISKATPAGDPWTNQHGGQMQTFFLDVEEIERGITVMCNRKTTSPPPSGTIWAEAEPGTTKKGGPKVTLRIKQDPEKTSFGVPEAPKREEDNLRNDDHIKAQWAIGQAINLVGGQEAPPDYETIEDVAKRLFLMVDEVKAVPKAIREEDDDKPPVALYDNLPTADDVDNFDLSSIPF